VLRFLAVFVLVFAGLFSIEMQESVQAAVIQPFTGWLAQLSAALITPFDDAVTSYGRVLRHSDTGFAVSIEAGCNGVEAMIVLIAAVLAFPAPWRSRLAALGLGFLAIQAMNIARIISLFYLGQWHREIFTWTHLYLWPVLIMLDVVVVFLVYLRYLAARSAPQPAGR
jgi:exosortase H (IPTLxxWG-CTERM-specific)